jgi:hypothetical protein
MELFTQLFVVQTSFRLTGSRDLGHLAFSSKFRTAAAELVGETVPRTGGSPKSEGAETYAEHGSC